MVQHGAMGSPLPRLLGTVHVGAWENASEVLSYLEQPGRCSLPSTIWHLRGSATKFRLLQSRSMSLRRPTAAQTFPYLTGTYFSSLSIFRSSFKKHLFFPSQTRHFIFRTGCSGLGLSVCLETNNKVNHCNIQILKKYTRMNSLCYNVKLNTQVHQTSETLYCTLKKKSTFYLC